jgi:hypothetical protein
LKGPDLKSYVDDQGTNQNKGPGNVGDEDIDDEDDDDVASSESSDDNDDEEIGESGDAVNEATKGIRGT